ncbi:FAD-dependent oxidoreductase [Halioglobus japonicus]|uniref:FAD-dependent oxidoreductase n=1 Tax=Halioglobus japonicus TaxID=930805 RepID=UPI000A03E80C|nr:FAD-dependent oxidoreductase [Halioglobus japonicus]
MSDSPEHSKGLSRRALLGAGAAAVTSAAAGAAALPAASIGGWDLTTDVLVAGSGAAGICAALEASAAGARVLLIESLGQPGGSSAMSGGVIYAGGGTALQKSNKIDDSIVEMYRFLKDVSGPGVSLPKVQLYCEESVAHFDWLLQQGVPFGGGSLPPKVCRWATSPCTFPAPSRPGLPATLPGPLPAGMYPVCGA